MAESGFSGQRFTTHHPADHDISWWPTGDQSWPLSRRPNEMCGWPNQQRFTADLRRQAVVFTPVEEMRLHSTMF